MRSSWHIQGSRLLLLLALLAGAWACVYAVERHGAPEAAMLRRLTAT